MKRAESQQPLMIAYIIFLGMCCAYYIVSGIFKLDFPVWDRIIASATIASYFFSLGSIHKLTAKMAQKQLGNLDDQNMLLREILRKEKMLGVDKGRIAELAELVNSMIADNEVEIDKAQKEITKARKWILRFDVIGFLVFFCIIGFDWLYYFFATSLDLYTLLAFIVVLFVDYIESTKVSLYEELCRSTTDKLKDILDF